ncbi:MAG TPA: hypothetical protein VGJ00_09960 [Rhabdochlamydiaceae bacterium]|jgi:hypothetical protein
MKKLIPATFSKETDRFIITVIQLEDFPLVFETMNSETVAEAISFYSGR